MAVKVTGAESSDQQGGRSLLEPLKELLPCLKLVWGDSHYGGTFRMWAKITLGWTIQTIKALTIPKRGLLVSEGEEVDWEKLFPTGFRPQPAKMGDRANLLLDHPLASPLPRSRGTAQQQ